MAMLKIEGKNYTELEALCEHLNDYHPALASEGNDINYIEITAAITKRTHRKRTKLSLAVVTGLSFNTADNIQGKKEIEQDRIERLCTKYESLVETGFTHPNDNAMLEKCRELSSKLSGNLQSNSKHPIDHFINSTWYVYEQINNNIGRKNLTFGGLKKDQIQVAENSYDNNLPELTGYGFINQNGNCLIIQTSNANEKTTVPINYIVRFNYTPITIDFLVAHMNITSNDNFNVVTKPVIFERMKSGKPKEPSIYETTPSEKDKRLREEIYSFFKRNLNNEIKLPHSLLVPSSEFITVPPAPDTELNNKIHPDLFGHYRTYYIERASYQNKGTKKIDRNYLFIKRDVDGSVVAILKNLVKNQKRTWQGKLIYSPDSTSFFAAMSGPYQDAAMNNATKIFLILTLPRGDVEFKALTGVVCGMTDEYNSALAMLLVIKKIENENISQTTEYSHEEYSRIEKALNNSDGNFNEERIIETFFDAYSNKVLVLPPRIKEIDDLQGLINDSPVN